MKKTNKFIAKKDNREMKILVSFAFILAIISLFSAYFITSLFDKDKVVSTQPNIIINENVSIVEDTQIENQNIQEMEEEIYNLIKTYIHASVTRENEILYAISTDEWKTILKEKLNNIETNNEEKLAFLSTSLTLNKNYLSNEEGLFNVSYIIENNKDNIQQNIEVEVIKQNNVWKISKIH